MEGDRSQTGGDFGLVFSLIEDRTSRMVDHEIKTYLDGRSGDVSHHT